MGCTWVHSAFVTLIKVSLRAGKEGQLVKYLPHKSEDLSWNHPEPTSKEGCIGICLLSQDWRSRGSQIPGTHWSPSLAELLSLETVFQKWVGKWLRKTPDVDLWPPHAHTCMHAYLHTCACEGTHMYTQTDTKWAMILGGLQLEVVKERSSCAGLNKDREGVWVCGACLSRIQDFLGFPDDPQAKEGCFQRAPIRWGACKEENELLTSDACLLEGWRGRHERCPRKPDFMS